MQYNITFSTITGYPNVIERLTNISNITSIALQVNKETYTVTKYKLNKSNNIH